MIRVLLADDHKIVREGLRSLLEREDGIEVIAEADNGRESVKYTRELSPDVVVMDLTMPEMNGFEATRMILADIPEARILALSMHSDRRFVMEALRAGARGFILKDCASEELVGAIRTVAANESYVGPRLAGEIIRDCLHRIPTELPETGDVTLSQLSFREREVLRLVSEGKNTKEIAFALSISIKTVETHRLQIMKKLNLFSIAELTKYAVREGLTTL